MRDRAWKPSGAGGTARLRDVFLVLAGAVLWGTTGTARALAPAGASPLAVGAARLLLGGLTLFALAAGRIAAAGLRSWPWPQVLLSALCMAAYQPLFFGGVSRTGVAVGTLVGIGSSPILAGLLAALLRGERLTRRWRGATLLAVAGTALLAGSGGQLRPDPLGLAMAVAAGCAYALYAVVSRRLFESHDPAAVTGLVFGLAGVALAPLLLASRPDWLLQARGALVALHLGLVATALAYTLFTRGLSRLPASTAATLSLAEPLTAALLGALLLRERLSPLDGLGAALLLAGFLLLVLPPVAPACAEPRADLQPPRS
ncbi:MAG: EamA family transporter [Bacillota bacterium]|nr:EamA family transporter [Bacillota bacterium]